MFEKTSFNKANEAIYLEEFYFFILTTHDSTLWMDIHQSDVPNLTEMFWLGKKVPQTQWGDATPSFPDSPLSFSRKAQFKEDDYGRWKSIKNPMK
ncbi:MAG: hypothetical protein GY827_05730 [Cytophagales bacterium]|nr:hypothetical protein [Cytophagales bacterium]